MIEEAVAAGRAGLPSPSHWGSSALSSLHYRVSTGILLEAVFRGLKTLENQWPSRAFELRMAEQPCR